MPLAKPSLLLLAACLALAAPASLHAQARLPAPPNAEIVSLRTADGYQVAGWCWRAKLAPKQKRAPTVLLLHMRGRDKASWGSLPETLRNEGYCVLAIDLRGHGETTGPQGRRIALEELTDADYLNMLQDVAAGHAWLAAQPGVDSERTAIIGASIGANLGLLYAARDRRVRTVICLSPGLDYRGLKPLAALEAYDKRPLYLLVAKGDRDSYESCLVLRDEAVKAKPASLRAFAGNEHGTELLRTHPGLDQTIVSGWLLNYLAPER